MNAGGILRRAGLDTPDLRVTMTPIDPDRVNVWPASRWMMLFWRKGISGMTIRNWVFVDPSLLTGDPKRLARLVIHELVHVRQYRDQGYVPFTVRYVYEYLAGLVAGKGIRESYLDIAAEREARQVTERLLLNE